MGQGNANSAAGATQGSAWNYSDEMLYTFGHGLSYLDYTQTIKSVTVDRSVNGNITAVVEVKNNSNQDGKFLTQLYVQQPYTDYDRTNLVEKSAVMFLNSAKVDVAAARARKLPLLFPPSIWQATTRTTPRPTSSMRATTTSRRQRRA